MSASLCAFLMYQCSFHWTNFVKFDIDFYENLLRE